MLREPNRPLYKHFKSNDNKLRRNETDMSQKGVPKQSHQYTLYPSGGNAGVYSRMQIDIKMLNVIMRYIAPSILHPLAPKLLVLYNESLDHGIYPYA